MREVAGMKVIEDPNCPPDTMYLIPASTWESKWFRDLLDSLKQDYERQLVALWNNGDEDD